MTTPDSPDNFEHSLEAILAPDFSIPCGNTYQYIEAFADRSIIAAQVAGSLAMNLLSISARAAQAGLDRIAAHRS